jgi:hypothetical protein
MYQYFFELAHFLRWALVDGRKRNYSINQVILIKTFSPELRLVVVDLKDKIKRDCNKI